MSVKQNILTAVGRLVWGSLYDPVTKDFDGNPMTVKNGPDKGKPTQRIEFGLAIPKNGTANWWDTELGAIILATAQKGFPGGEWQRTDFSWKVTDGDSTVIPPKSKSKTPPCNREGFPGHWIFKFSSGFAPRIYNADASQQLLDAGVVKTGYYIQVSGTVDKNTGNSPGVYLNHNMIALSGYGPEITTGPDAASVGFGKAALPSGASATPVGGMTAPSGVPGGVPGGVPSMPVARPAMPAAAAAAPAMSIAVSPAPSFLATPGAGAAPSMPSAPAAPIAPAMPSGPVLTAKANGVPYAEFLKQGWTDAALRQHGYMV